MADQGSIANLKQNINENIYDNTDYDISGGRLNTVLQNVVDTLEFNGRDFFNVNEYREKSDAYADAAAGRAAVPDEEKKLGLVITYLLADGWYIDQFIGSNISGWETASNWEVLGPVIVSQNTIILPNWSANTPYVVGNQVQTGNPLKYYRCTTAHTSESTFDSSKWEEISEFAFGGTNLISINIGSDAQPIYLNCVSLKGFATSSESVNAPNIGDIYYNTATHLLMTRVSIGQASNWRAYPFIDGAIYTYNNELYVWNGSDLYRLNDYTDAQIYNTNKEIPNVALTGKGWTYVKQDLNYLISGHRYKICIKNPNWAKNDIGNVPTAYLFQVVSILNGNESILVGVKIQDASTLKDTYEILMPNNDSAYIGLRANAGENVFISVVDITDTISETDLNSVNRSIIVVGKGNEFSLTAIKGLKEGKDYVLRIFNPDWDLTGIYTITGITLFGIYSMLGTTEIPLITPIKRPNTQRYYSYRFTVPKNDSVYFGLRAAIGERIYFEISEYSETDKEYIGMEQLFLGSSYSQCDFNEDGGLDGTENSTRVSQNSCLQIPYPYAKLKFKLPPYIYCGITFGDFSYGLSTVFKWMSNGSEITIPNKLLYYRLRFAKGTEIKPAMGGIATQDISVAEVLNYIYTGDIRIYFDNPIDIFSANSEQEKLAKICMRKYTTQYGEHQNYGFNYFASFIHATDIHGDTVRMQRLMKYADFLNVDAVLATGDIVCGDTRNRADFMKELDEMFKTDILSCVGNHDAYGTSIFDNGGTIGINPIYRQYTTITKQTTDKTGVITPSGVDYPTYYYKDLDSRKLRIIALNRYEKGRDYTYGGCQYMSSEQINWFIEVLANIPADYGVIVMMHEVETSIDKDNNYPKFYDNSPFTVQSRLTGAPLRTIIDAFISKTSGNGSYTQYVNGVEGTSETINYSYDFSQVASNEFIAYLTGHEHVDKVGYVHGANNKQLMLNETCTESGYGYSYISAANISDLPRESGATQDSFNLYVIDRDSKTIRMARIGSNQDANFELRDFQIIPYSD